jgi:AraC-like DNA-binding protein
MIFQDGTLLIASIAVTLIAVLLLFAVRLRNQHRAADEAIGFIPEIVFVSEAEKVEAQRRPGKRGPKRKLTNEQAAIILNRRLAGEKIDSLAHEFGVSRETLYRSFRRMVSE